LQSLVVQVAFEVSESLLLGVDLLPFIIQAASVGLERCLAGKNGVALLLQLVPFVHQHFALAGEQVGFDSEMVLLPVDLRLFFFQALAGGVQAVPFVGEALPFGRQSCLFSIDCGAECLDLFALEGEFLDNLLRGIACLPGPVILPDGEILFSLGDPPFSFLDGGFALGKRVCQRFEAVLLVVHMSLMPQGGGGVFENGGLDVGKPRRPSRHVVLPLHHGGRGVFELGALLKQSVLLFPQQCDTSVELGPAFAELLGPGA
jgi:hypothetical protein